MKCKLLFASLVLLASPLSAQDQYAPWFERHRVGPQLPRANTNEWRGCRNCYREPTFRSQPRGRRAKTCRQDKYSDRVVCSYD